ncbi:MAG: DUF2905 domain-containing protein [Ignavibacteria bacterium]|nr:DUF2905 domain-containing protein [Ignavibacteria bacterium]
MTQQAGKLLIISGLIIAAIGVIIMYSDKIPFLGKLPGDIRIKKDNFEFYFPLATSIVISLIISLIMYLIYKMRGG